MNDKFAFLLSTRFWQLFLVGVSAGLTTYENTNNWMLAVNAGIIAWLGGSVVVRTVDRNTGDASGVTTVSMPEGVKSVTSTKK